MKKYYKQKETGYTSSYVDVPVCNEDGKVTGHERVTFEINEVWNGIEIFNVDFTDAHPDDVCNAIRSEYNFIESITFKTR